MNKEIDLGLYASKDKQWPDWSKILTIEKLLRLHSHWFVSDLQINENNFTVKVKDHVTEKFSLLQGAVVYNDVNILDNSTNDFVKIDLRGDISFTITLCNTDGKITARVILEEGGGESDNKESALLWLRGIREYIRLYLATNPNTLFFRVIMNKMMLKMNPSQRKICLMITKITMIEVLVIIIIVVGYVIFMK